MTTEISSQIQCEMDAEPAAIERISRVIRVRGFRIRQLRMDSCDQTLLLRMDVVGDRPIGMLKSQLEKLHTVRMASVLQPVADGATETG